MYIKNMIAKCWIHSALSGYKPQRIVESSHWEWCRMATRKTINVPNRNICWMDRNDEKKQDTKNPRSPTLFVPFISTPPNLCARLNQPSERILFVVGPEKFFWVDIFYKNRQILCVNGHKCRRIRFLIANFSAKSPSAQRMDVVLLLLPLHCRWVSIVSM